MRTNIFRQRLLLAVMMILCVANAQAATFKVNLTVSPGDNGKVFAATTKADAPKPSSFTSDKIALSATGSSGENTMFYLWATPNSGYYFSSWNTTKDKGAITIGSSSQDTATCMYPTRKIFDNISSSSFNLIYTNNYTATANFEKIALTPPSGVTITPAPTNALTSCDDYTGTLTFTASHPVTTKDISGVTVKTNSGHGTLTASVERVSGKSITVSYTFKGSDTYGGSDNNRNNSFTVTLTTEAGESASCNVTANFPDVVISDGTAGKVFPETPLTDVKGEAVFPVTYSDGAGDFTAEITDPTGGTWKRGTISFASTNTAIGAGNITVPFTFNAGGSTDECSATLTLTPTYGGGVSKTLTLKAKANEKAEHDASIGDTKYTKLAEAIAAANEMNTNPTVKILRNVEGLTSTLEIKKPMTIDLNSYKVSGTLTSSVNKLFYLNTATAVLTVNDSRNGGKISATGNAAAALTAVLVNQGSLVLTKGDIEIENTNTGASAAAKAVKITAGARFVQTAGNLKATSAGTGAYGLEVTTTPDNAQMVVITGGTINTTAAAKSIGIDCESNGVSTVVDPSPEKANVVLSGVTVNAETTGTTEAYAVRTAAGVILGINSGTYNATAKTTTAYTLHTSGYTAVVNGTFNATAKEKIARAIHVAAGITAVKNGMFNAKAQTEKAHTCYVASGAKLLTYGGTFHGKLENANANQYATGAYIEGTLEAQGGTFIGEVAKTGLAAAQTNYAVGVCLAATATNVTIASATLRGVTDNNFVNGAHALYTATTNEVNLTNCVLMASSASSYAYGVRVEGATPLKMKNCLVTAEAATSYTYGFYQNNATSTIEVANSKFTITSNNIYAYGAHVNNGTFTANKCDFVVKTKQTTATAAANSFLRGIYVNTGKRAYLTGCTIDASGNATYSKEGYGIHVDGSADVDDCNVAVSDINSGAYAIYNSRNTTAINVASGKFKATAATGTFVETNATAAAEKQKLYGGYYVHHTNLSKYLPTGYGIDTLPKTAAEYAEGYRYAVRPPANLEKAVCKIGAVGYSTLEEALEYAGKKATGNNELIILMVADYTLPAGDYVLPQYTTLLVPMKDQPTPIKANVERLTQPQTRICNNLLTLASGVHLSVYGTIETGSQQFAGSQASGYQTGSYGRIHTDTGVRIDLESGSTVYCWGYITGGAEIHAKRNSTIYEHFEIGDFKGGGVAAAMLTSWDNRNKKKVFMVTHYFYQSIEATVVYHPGSKGLGSTSVQANGDSHPTDGVKIVGETGSGALFLMDAKDARENTWLKKEYNPATERATWTLNSGATLGSLTINIPGYEIPSEKFILPIASHMDLKLNYGAMTLKQSTYFMPGSKFEVGREATLKIPSGAELYFIDKEKWVKGYSVSQYICTPNFSPTRSGNGPRHGMKNDTTDLPDAEFFIHGTVEVIGTLYTSDPGANLHSTNEDAGKVIFIQAPPSGSKSFYQCNDSCGCNMILDKCSGTYYWNTQEHTCYSAKLKNKNGNYVSTAGVQVGTKYIYKNDEWVKITTDGCLEVETISGVEHKYAYTTEFVEVAENSSDNAYHDAAHVEGAEGCRYFIYTDKKVTSEGCVWWEATKEGEGMYKAKLPDHNGKINYYTFDESSGYWKVSTVTVSWMNTGSTVADYTVGYNTVPEYLDPTPTKPSTSSEYYTWTGWTKGSETGEFFSKDEALPKVTENTTYYAYFEAHTYEYTITMKNYDGTFLEAKRWAYGEKPLCETLPIKPATTSKEYSFDGWSTSLNGERKHGIADLPPVALAATYYAHFAEAARKYTIQWVNYNGTVLKEEQVAYNSIPVEPVDPTRPNDSYYTYTFAAWSPSISTVTGNQIYTATYTYEKKVPKYTATFKNGSTTIYTQNLVADAHPAFGGTIPTKTADAQYTYTFDGWSTTDGGELAYASGDELPSLTADVTYYAHFATTTNNYRIIWKSENGKVTLKTDPTVPYGTTPSFDGATPTKDRVGKTGYTFDGWSASIGGDKLASLPNVTEDNVFYAHFLEGTYYNITFRANGHGATPAGYEVIGGSKLSAPEAPTETGYTFGGWYKESACTNAWNFATETVTGDVTLYAKWTVNKYTITWLNEDGTLIDKTEVEYGVVPTHADATKQSNEYTYTFTGWNPEPQKVTGNATYTAQFSEERREYTITWNNADNALLATTKSYWGDMPVYPNPTPIYTDNEHHVYRFVGWTPEVHAVNSDVNVYTAVYEIVDNLDVPGEQTINVETTVTTTKVHVTGHLVVTSNLKTTDLILEGTLNTSGEIENNGTVTATNVYYDLSNGAEGFKARTWYAIAVPWQVDVPAYNQAGCGVYLTNDGVNYSQQNLGASFDLLYYDGAYRAQNGPSSKCWKLVEKDAAANHIIFPGRAYMIYLTSDAKTIRFKKKATADLFTNQTQVQLYDQQTGNDKDANWNGIANPATFHAYLNTASGNQGQIYIAGADRYEPIADMSAHPLVVGQPVFVQATNDKTVVAYATNDDYVNHAPRRMSSSNEEKILAEVRIAPLDKAYTDRLYVGAEEFKADEYEIGKDLAKAGVSTKVAQMWVNRYNAQLCINSMELVNNRAEYPLTISAPAAGEYTIGMEPSAMAENQTYVLYLTLNGQPIWNLNYNAYTATLEKGTTEGYGLRLVYNAPEITTGIEETTILNGEQVRKVMIDEKVYIIRGGQVYSIDGQLVKY